jgi:hypothetical protein
MEHKKKDVITIDISRPTGPRVIAGPPRRQGYLERYVPRFDLSPIKQRTLAVVSILRRPRVAAVCGSLALAVITHLALAGITNGFQPLFQASLLLTGAGVNPAPSGGGGAYVGPGDLSISNVVAWHGLRAYSLATAGTKAINLCDNTGANCSDESTDASGNLVVGTHGANNCATSDTCVVKTLYDQSGALACGSGCDVTQATTANMFTLKHNCRAGTQFCLVGTSVTAYAAIAGLSSALSQTPSGITATVVGRRTAGTAFTDLIGDALGGGVQIGFSNVSGSALAFAGSVASVAGLTEGNMYALNVLLNGASSNLNVNGVSNTVSTGTSGVTNLCVASCANGGSIEFYEGGWWSGDRSSSFTALYGNEHTYWGF